jgi:hypothetical protein
MPSNCACWLSAAERRNLTGSSASRSAEYFITCINQKRIKGNTQTKRGTNLTWFDTNRQPTMAEGYPKDLSVINCN